MSLEYFCVVSKCENNFNGMKGNMIRLKNKMKVENTIPRNKVRGFCLFPEDVGRCKRWLSLLNPARINEQKAKKNRYWRLCDRHFKKSDFLNVEDTTVLKSKAVPSLHLPKVCNVRRSDSALQRNAVMVIEDTKTRYPGQIESRLVEYVVNDKPVSSQCCIVPHCRLSELDGVTLFDVPSSSKFKVKISAADGTSEVLKMGKAWLRLAHVDVTEQVYKSKSLKMCSQHFTLDNCRVEYLMKGLKIDLLQDALPSLRLTSSDVTVANNTDQHEETAEEQPQEQAMQRLRTPALKLLHLNLEDEELEEFDGNDVPPPQDLQFDELEQEAQFCLPEAKSEDFSWVYHADDVACVEELCSVTIKEEVHDVMMDQIPSCSSVDQVPKCCEEEMDQIEEEMDQIPSCSDLNQVPTSLSTTVEIYEFQSFCRVCASPNQTVTNIFSKCGWKEKIEKYLGLKVEKSDIEMPQGVCRSCRRRLNRWDMFATAAKRAERGFRSKLRQWKQNASPSEVHPSGLSLSEVHPSGLSPSEVHLSEVHPGGLSPSKVHHSEVHPSGLSPSEVHHSEDHPSGLSPSEVHHSEVHPSGLSPSEVHHSEVHPSGLSPSKVHHHGLPPGEDHPTGLPPSEVPSPAVVGNLVPYKRRITQQSRRIKYIGEEEKEKKEDVVTVGYRQATRAARYCSKDKRPCRNPLNFFRNVPQFQFTREYQCLLCGHSVEDLFQLNLHTIVKHNKEICDICCEAFEDTAAIRKHKVEEHFKRCKFCDESFRNKHIYNSHLKKIHDAEPKYIKFKNDKFANHYCKICNKRSQSNHTAKYHYFWEHMLYACDICFQLFETSLEQMKHTDEVHMTPCPYCTEKNYTSRRFKRHLNAHKVQSATKQIEISKTKDQIYECEFCGSGLSTKENVKRHGFWCHNKFTCLVCLESFAQSEEQEEHFKSHGNVCTSCESQFDTKTELTEHMNSHPGFLPRFCDNCGDRFAGKAELRVHAQSHDVKATLLCDICGKHYKTRTALDMHRYSHTKERKECEVCSKKFIFQSQLQSHMVTHTQEKSFKCLDCGASFYNSQQLKDHFVIHDLDLLVNCSMCNVRLARRELQTHVSELHANASVLQCTVCDKCMVDESDMLSHVKTHSQRRNSYHRVNVLFCHICCAYFVNKSKLWSHVKKHFCN